MFWIVWFVLHLMSGCAPFDAASERWHRSLWGWFASRWCCVHGLVWKQPWGFNGQCNVFAILVSRICSDACFNGSSSCLQRNQQLCNCDDIQHLLCMWYYCSCLKFSINILPDSKSSSNRLRPWMPTWMAMWWKFRSSLWCALLACLK